MRKQFLWAALAAGVLGSSPGLVNEASAVGRKWKVSELSSDVLKKTGQTFFFPDSSSIKNTVGADTIFTGNTAAADAAGYGEEGKDTVPASQANFTYKVEIVKALTSGPLAGEVKIIGGRFHTKLIGTDGVSALSGQTLTIPEFVWVKSTNTSETAAYFAYKVVEVDKEFFNNLKKVDSTALVGSDSITFSKAVLPLSGVKFSIEEGKLTDFLEPDFLVKTVGTWYVSGGTANNLSWKDAHSGSTYFSYDSYVEGAREIANNLYFGKSGDARTFTLSKESLKTLQATLHSAGVGSKTGKPKVSLSIGDTTHTGGFTVTLGADAFGADSLANYVDTLLFGSQVTGNLGTAGFAKFRKTAYAIDTTTTTKTFEVDFKHVGFKLDNDKKDVTPLQVIGDGLFAGFKKDTITFTFAKADSGFLNIGKEWFKESHVRGVDSLEALTIGERAFYHTHIDTVVYKHATSIGAGAFIGVTGTTGKVFSVDTIDFKNFPALKSIGDSAFQGAVIKNLYTRDAIESIGAEAFKGAYVSENDTLRGNTFGIPTDSTIWYAGLKSAKTIGKDAFAGVSSAEDSVKFTAVVIGDTLAKVLVGPSEVNGSAFGGELIVWAPFSVKEAWGAALTGAKEVKPYGFPKESNPFKYIGILNKFGEEPNLDTLVSKGYYKIGYGFNESRILSFYAGVKAGNIKGYSVTGPVGAKTLITDGITEVTTSIAENGISLEDKFLQAGLYVINGYKELTGEKDRTPEASIILEVKPTSLKGFTADTLKVTFAGAEHIEEQLAEFSEKDVLLLNATGDTVFGAGNLLPSDATLKVGEKITISFESKPDTLNNVLTLKGLGNFADEIPVVVIVNQLDVEGAITLPPVDFTLNEKSFPIKDEVKVKHGEHTFEVPAYDGFGDESKEELTYVEVTYADGSTLNKPGKVEVTLKGHGKLSGEFKTSYTIKANWKDYAAIDTKPETYKLGVEKTFDGTGLSSFEGLVKPLILLEGEYEIVAIPATPETVDTQAAIAEAGSVTSLNGAGDYDFYILPGAELKATYPTEAVYIGNYKINSLEFEALKEALTIKKVIIAGEESNDTTYTLSVDKKVYVGKFEAEYDGTKKSFEVKLDSVAALSISGLEGFTFTVELPTAEPTSLTFTDPFSEYSKGTLFFEVGDTIDLNDYVNADAAAKVDFYEGLTWEVDNGNKLEIVEGHLLTATDVWNGHAKGTYLDTELTVEFDVKVVENRPPMDGTEAIGSVSQSIVYSGGELIVKGYSGSKVTVYGLNGGIVGGFVSGGDVVSYGLGLSKGFYLVQVGGTVTKIIVK
jgi:hypothetical protein